MSDVTLMVLLETSLALTVVWLIVAVRRNTTARHERDQMSSDWMAEHGIGKGPFSPRA